jgi:hypothetical protein
MKSCNFLPHICVNELRHPGIGETIFCCNDSLLACLLQSNTKGKQGGVSHCGLAIYIKKYLKAKEELWKLKYFTMQQYNLPKQNPLKETKILQDIITLELISSSNISQNIIFQKSSYKTNRPITT